MTSCGRTVEKAGENFPERRETTQYTTATPTTEAATEPPVPIAPAKLEVDLDWPEDYDIPRSARLDFETLFQEPELPTGCEITSLAQVLNFYGFDIDKSSLSDYFLPQDFDGWYNMDRRYLGDPHSENGFGCNSTVIVRTADDYFDYLQSDWYAVDLSGTPFRELFYQIDQGRPVVVWATMNLMESYPTYQFELGCGEEFWFNGYHHCVAIYGYDLDEGIVWTADPLEGAMAYSIDQFELIYGIMDSQAVVLVGNDESAGVDYSDNEYKYQWMLARHPAWFGLEQEDEVHKYWDYYDYDNPVRFEDDRMINVYFD